MKEQTPAYLNALTFPRFILAMLVVVVHFGLHLDYFNDSFFGGVYNHGAVAVSFFFFLSGFVLAYNYNSNTSPRAFLLKRLFRLYPTYLLTFFIVLITLYFAEGNAPTFLHGILNMLGLQSWTPGYALEVNFPSWSLSVEFFFYLSFPIILWLYKKMKRSYFLVLAFLIIILGAIEHYIAVVHIYEPDRFFLDQFILYFPPFHFSTFVAGFLCGKWIHSLKEKNIDSRLFSLIAFLGIVGFIMIMNVENYYRQFTHNGGLIPVFAMICIGLALDKKIFNVIFGWKPLRYLGEISYSIYMWQFPVFLFFKHSLSSSPLSPGMFILFVITLIIWSAVAYEVFEKPVRKLLSRNYIYAK
mgnify:CR=1 FL=1|tara:strand:- start:124907 stop:125974 length:1068 start_codon:yes stop_codon:yes gene_type:complete